MQKLRSKLNIGVALVMVLMIIPGFFAFTNGKTADKSVSKSKNTVAADKKEISNAWEIVPQRPVAYNNIIVYKDQLLKHAIGTIKARNQLNIIEIEGKSFKLSDGDYISADKNQVISDVTISRKDDQTILYTTKTISVFDNPVTTYDNEVMSVLTGTHQFLSDKVAQTHWGTYYEISLSDGRKGWVSENDISLENPKLQTVQRLLQTKYSGKKYSIYVKILNDKFTVGVNQNEKMYSASLSKIPILYWTQKQINDGYASLNDKLLYTTAVNTFFGSYKPDGTGNLPKTADNKVYSLGDIINRTAKLSDNVGSNMLAYYETKSFGPSYQKEINQIAGSPWNPETREASAQMVGKMLEALYNEGGAAFNALFNTSFDNVKIKAGVPQNIPVAHKIGDADNDNHDAAIIFSSQPYVLVIETDGGTDQEIQQISQDIYEVMQ